MTTLRPSAVSLGDEDARHAAAAELALEGVGGAEGLLELGAPVQRPRRRGGRSGGRHCSIVGRVPSRCYGCRFTRKVPGPGPRC